MIWPFEAGRWLQDSLATWSGWTQSCSSSMGVALMSRDPLSRRSSHLKVTVTTATAWTCRFKTYWSLKRSAEHFELWRTISDWPSISDFNRLAIGYPKDLLILFQLGMLACFTCFCLFSFFSGKDGPLCSLRPTEKVGKVGWAQWLKLRDRHGHHDIGIRFTCQPAIPNFIPMRLVGLAREEVKFCCIV